MSNEVPYYIRVILEKNTITDILKDNNIYPAFQQGDKIYYHCPLHDKDNDPSFIVYTDKQYQDYYCFGCKRGGNVINLLSDLKHISLQYAIHILAEDIEINDEQIMSDLIRALEEGNVKNNDQELYHLYLSINRLCYNYLSEQVSFNKNEVAFIENIYKKIDKIFFKKKYEDLKTIYDFLLNKGLKKRLKYFRKKEKERKAYEYEHRN
ncbi:MAG: CHC2 zinc finger domain-containing protein [bacterium]